MVGEPVALSHLAVQRRPAVRLGAHLHPIRTRHRRAVCDRFVRHIQQNTECEWSCVHVKIRRSSIGYKSQCLTVWWRIAWLAAAKKIKPPARAAHRKDQG